MTIASIIERAKAEAALHETALKVRQLLDTAAKEIQLPNDRDPVEEILSLVSEDE